MNQTSKVDPTNAGYVASPQLKQILDVHARGEISAEELVIALIAVCRGNSDATWEALSLLDQYHRRGLLKTNVFLIAKAEIHALVFGAPPADRDISALRAGEEPRHQAALAASSFNPIAELKASNELKSTDAVPPNSAPNAQDEPDDSSAGLLRTGTVLRNRYVLVAPITSTTTCTIFKAFDRQRAGLPESDCFVSIKSMRDEFATAAALTALQQEFLLAGKLSHPNILSLYDCYQHTDRSFIVMELLQGRLLSHVIDRCAPQPIGRSQALAIIREIGLALAYAHRQGVTHTHLDPTMIAIMPSGEIRLFGFAAAEKALSDDVKSDHIGARVSVPVYRTEQSTRDRQTDTRDDIFSLACIAYQLLSGRSAFTKLNGKIEPSWQKISSLPTKQWKALEHALNADRTQRPTAVREWLFAFDSESAVHTLSPLSELRPEPIRPTRRTGKSFVTAALSVLAIGALTVLWYVFVARENTPIPERSAQSLDLPESLTEATANASTPDLNTAQEPLSSGAEINTIVQTNDVSVTEKSNASEIRDASKPLLSTEQKLVASTTNQSPAQFTSAAVPASSSVVGQGRPAPIISFSADQFSVNEGEATARLTVRRSGSVQSELILHWRTIEGSAKADRDYVGNSNGVLAIPSGARTAFILVPIVQHGERRYSEWFDVELKEATGANLGTVARATVVIVTKGVDAS
ncbi:MAG: protein kinase [Candidatus Obscuribacterales bacterium]|nr:protein kinase [Steroidobacteraceae bacterium]